ncbi:MAG: hypothetical protein ABJO01_10190 [Parasphingorhabdus sp.]
MDLFAQMFADILQLTIKKDGKLLLSIGGAVVLAVLTIIVIAMFTVSAG